MIRRFRTVVIAVASLVSLGPSFASIPAQAESGDPFTYSGVLTDLAVIRRTAHLPATVSTSPTTRDLRGHFGPLPRIRPPLGRQLGYDLLE